MGFYKFLSLAWNSGVFWTEERHFGFSLDSLSDKKAAYPTVYLVRLQDGDQIEILTYQALTKQKHLHYRL